MPPYKVSLLEENDDPKIWGPKPLDQQSVGMRTLMLPVTAFGDYGRRVAQHAAAGYNQLQAGGNNQDSESGALQKAAGLAGIATSPITGLLPSSNDLRDMAARHGAGKFGQAVAGAVGMIPDAAAAVTGAGEMKGLLGALGDGYKTAKAGANVAPLQYYDALKAGADSGQVNGFVAPMPLARKLDPAFADAGAELQAKSLEHIKKTKKFFDPDMLAASEEFRQKHGVHYDPILDQSVFEFPTNDFKFNRDPAQLIRDMVKAKPKDRVFASRQLTEYPSMESIFPELRDQLIRFQPNMAGARYAPYTYDQAEQIMKGYPFIDASNFSSGRPRGIIEFGLRHGTSLTPPGEWAPKFGHLGVIRPHSGNPIVALGPDALMLDLRHEGAVHASQAAFRRFYRGTMGTGPNYFNVPGEVAARLGSYRGDLDFQGQLRYSPLYRASQYHSMDVPYEVQHQFAKTEHRTSGYDALGWPNTDPSKGKY